LHLRLHKVELANFRSFVGHHVFEVPHTFGLYSLTGRNINNPRLGGNGVGKSSLIDAIVWALFGRTSRGLKATDIISYGQKTCTVSVALTVAHKRLVVKRDQSPNTLILAEDNSPARPVSQEQLEKHLRLGPEAFLRSVIFPQFGESFLDLSPSAKLILFSDILELDYWIERSQAAADEAKELEYQKGAVTEELAHKQGQEKILREDIDEFDRKHATFKKDQDKIIDSYKKTFAETVEEEQGIARDLPLIEQSTAKAKVRLETAKGKQVCPTCKQKIPNSDLVTLEQIFIDWDAKLKQQRKRQEYRLQSIAALNADIIKEQNRENPYADTLDKKVASLEKVRVKVISLKASIKQCEEELVAVTFWVSGFKRIRLFIVDETLRQLEIEVNNNLTSLGLIGWRIEFDIERENKSGGMTKGFVVLVYPPDAETPIKYESFSGGETQRIRMAGDLGLANLIMERAGLTNTLEVYDEPSQHLSQEGVLDLAETLQQRAIDQGKVILLVDHTAIEFGGFEGTFTCVKDARGSRLE
jgi:DNA repair exonuclease SbcCD ATPase subunit